MTIDRIRSFKEHIEYASIYIRQQYGLVVEQTSDGDVELRNNTVVITFYKGNVREPYVGLSISYLDSSILGETKSIWLEDYISYLDAWETFFPVSNISGNRIPYYCYSDSPFQVLEIVVFLGARGEPLLKANNKKIQVFMEWVYERNRKYTDEMSKPNKG